MSGYNDKAAAIWSSGLQALPSPIHSAVLLSPCHPFRDPFNSSVCLPKAYLSHFLSPLGNLIYNCSPFYCHASGHTVHFTIHCFFELMSLLKGVTSFKQTPSSLVLYLFYLENEANNSLSLKAEAVREMS